MNKSRPVVYVVHEVSHNYEPAEKFGEVRFVTALNLSAISSSSINQSVYRDIKMALKDYVPGHDYILSSGNPATIALVMMTLGVLYGGNTHNFLRWDALKKEYINHVLTTRNITNAA